MNILIENSNEQIKSLKKENSKQDRQIQFLNETIKKKDEQISNSNDKFGTQQNKIDELNAKLINSDKELDLLKNLILDKDKEIERLKSEPIELRKKNEELSKNNIVQKDKIIEKANEINKLKEVNINLKKENDLKENKYFILNDKFKKLEDEKKEKEKQIIILNEELKKLRENNVNYKKLENQIKKINENSDKSFKYEKLKKEDFYDIIIKCNSIIALKKGWEISMTEDGKKNYFDYKDSKFTKIGVIGSENRGKSTILSDFSKIELPTGVSIKTEGLSIKYPELSEFKNRKIILLDSAGLETPILKTENIPNEENQQDNINEEKKSIKIENGGEDIKHENKKENVHAIFENKSRDIIQLELFLQNFIIKYSDILILILGKLTINEQKLLLKVNSHIKSLNRKEPLIVIHNLKEFETLNQINDYVENILKKILNIFFRRKQ